MPVIRKLVPADLPRLRDHFHRLDSNDRYLRFGHGVAPEVAQRYLERLDWFGAILLGAFEGGELRGFVEVVPMSEGFDRSAELALTVEKAWRGHGLGTELCRRALVLACNRRIRQVAMICLTENVPMQRIAAKLDGKVLSRDGDVETSVRLPHPSPWSLMQEAAITGGALVGQFADQWGVSDDQARQPAA